MVFPSLRARLSKKGCHGGHRIELSKAVRGREGQDASLPVGVAVHAGPAFVGKVGSGDIHDFTALGDTVNTAARMQAHADAGEVIMSEELYDEVREAYPDLEQRTLKLRGRRATVQTRVISGAVEESN